MASLPHNVGKLRLIGGPQGHLLSSAEYVLVGTVYVRLSHVCCSCMEHLAAITERSRLGARSRHLFSSLPLSNTPIGVFLSNTSTGVFLYQMSASDVSVWHVPWLDIRLGTKAVPRPTNETLQPETPKAAIPIHVYWPRSRRFYVLLASCCLHHSARLDMLWPDGAGECHSQLHQQETQFSFRNAAVNVFAVGSLLASLLVEIVSTVITSFLPSFDRFRTTSRARLSFDRNAELNEKMLSTTLYALMTE